MTHRLRQSALALLAASALAAAAAPAAAQDTPRDTGIPTETQERLAKGMDNDFDWSLLGLLGLFGLLGLVPRKDPDYSHAIG